MIILLILLIIALLIAGCIWVGFHTSQTKKLVYNYEQQITDLQDLAWRAQMNPHFLNNCLNNINAVIHKLDRDTASSYLTCLSRLMRKILEHSDESKITLAQELDVISHYIKLEKLRFGDDMIITVSVEETLQIDKVCVPPLFIQPFLENAILHGILPKNEAGNIEIRLCTLGPEILCCTITDDGVGRSKLEKPIEAFPTGKRSMGMAITNKRISSFNKRNGKSLPVTVNDLKDNNGLSTGTSIGIQLVLISDNDD